MFPDAHRKLADQWRLDTLIGRAAEQVQLEQLLRTDVPARRGRTVVITGPVGAGRAALARFALGDSLVSLPRSIEFDASTGAIWYPPKSDERSAIKKAAEAALSDIGQRLPFPLGTLVAVLAAFLPEKERDAYLHRVAQSAPTPTSLPAIVQTIAGAGPFAIHIAGLDNPALDEDWHSTIIELITYIHDRWPVLIILTTATTAPLQGLADFQMTPLQRRLQPLIQSQTVSELHLGPVSVADVRRYVHQPADDKVIRRLHELAGGWPLMVQALWRDWHNSAAKPDGGGSREPVIAGDGLNTPWHFTMHGLTATQHVEELLGDLLREYDEALEKLKPHLEADEEPVDTLQWILSVSTLEGQSFTGEALAAYTGLPWEDGLEDVFDELVTAQLLIDDPIGYVELDTPEGKHPLYRYQLALPIWWQLFQRALSDADRQAAAADLAGALETTYGPLAWQRMPQIVALWEQANMPERVRYQRRYLEQHAMISRLSLRAAFEQQAAERSGTWKRAYLAWIAVADAMKHYVTNDATIAAYEAAGSAARRGKATLDEANALAITANFLNIIEDRLKAEHSAQLGLEVLKNASDPQANSTRGALFHELGSVYHAQGDLDQALRYFEQARALKEVHSPPSALAPTLHTIGRVYHDQGDLDQALRYFEQARALKEAHSPPSALATTLHEIGRVYHDQGDLDQALRYFEQARVLEESHSPPSALASTLYAIGRVYHDQDDLDQALRYLQQARVLEESHSPPSALAPTLHEIGRVYHDQGDLDQALRYYEQARALAEAHNPPSALATTLHEIGRVYHDQDDLDQALVYYQQARVLEESHSPPSALAPTLHEIGRVYHDQGDLDQALAYYQQALPLGKESNDKKGHSYTLHRLARVLHVLGRNAEALEYVERCLDIKRRIGSAYIAETEELQRQILAALGQ